MRISIQTEVPSRDQPKIERRKAASPQDICPGRITACAHCQTQEDCLESGGSIFIVPFPGMAKDTGEKLTLSSAS